MILLAPVLLLLTALIVMFSLRSIRGAYAYRWLVASGSLLITWVYLLILRGKLPIEAQIPTWQPPVLFPETPILFLDSVSWSFALGVITLAVAVMLTAVTRLVVGSWLPWAGTVALGGVSLVAVMAGNPLMLLIAWATLDLADVLIVLVQVNSSPGRQRAVIALAARIAGMLLLIWALMVARSAGGILSFQAIPANVSPYLLLAAGLRLGVIPLQVPLLEEIPLRRGLGTSLKLLPAASSLVLLVRAANSGVSPVMAVILLVPTAVAALYSALSWLLASDVLSARSFWILGMAAFAVASALNGDVQATMAWGLALLLAGSYLFLLSPNHIRLLPLGFLGLLSLSAFPFTLTWAGLGMYANPFSGWMGAVRWAVSALLFCSHMFMLLGYLKFAFRFSSELPQFERWAWLVYPLGLAFPILASYALGWLNRPELNSLPSFYWFFGLLTLALSVGGWAVNERSSMVRSFLSSRMRVSGWSTTLWASVLSMVWLYRLAWFIYQTTGRLLNWLTRLLEGDGGLIWAFVLLAFLWSLFLV